MNIVDLGKNKLKIGNQIITGFVRDEKCDGCSCNLIYDDKFDADFCPNCNEWRDIRCPDTNCETCRNRPSKPLNTSEFLISKDISYDNIVDILDELFPEYVSNTHYYESSNRELQYSHLGNLCLMIFEDIDKEKDNNLVDRLVKFANYIINNYGGELQNLFCVEVLEHLTGSRKSAHLAKQYLTDKALETFHDTTKFYHTTEFLDEYFKVFKMNPIIFSDPKSLFAYMKQGLIRPSMSAPDDDTFLDDIRSDLELDEDLIAGTLSYLSSKSIPPEEQIKNLRNLHRDVFTNYKEKLNNHNTNSPKNKKYINELLAFINDLGRITTNVDIWIWNNFHK